jgi:hypothetical protein
MYRRFIGAALDGTDIYFQVSYRAFVLSLTERCEQCFGERGFEYTKMPL